MGIDLVPFKVCSFDCVYCECGGTTDLVLERKEYISVSSVLEELDHYLNQAPTLDFITFSGAGEPTLNSGIGIIIKHIKANYPQYKLALLTNGTLFHDKQLCQDLLSLDLVKLSVDAGSDMVYRKINRASSSLSYQKFQDGILYFDSIFKNEIWLEYFLIPEVNDSDQEVEKAASFLSKLSGVSKLQINTLDRPPVKNWVRKASLDDVHRVQRIFQTYLQYEVVNIGKFKQKKKQQERLSKNNDIAILAAISRRPMTVKDLFQVTGIPTNIISDELENLISLGKIISKKDIRGLFFELKR